ncbi:MAG: hypothetical protein LBT09_06390 [Planctomycetaceae bacterium]|jgi:hypothetical protein|nr:hypothetical protein [Planctomycetaceae bacterium]
MDARFFNSFFGVVLFCVTLFLIVPFSYSSQFETVNFTVDGADTLEQARVFCETAEKCRRELAVLWLGEELPDWSSKCPITVRVGDKLGAGGATTFIFQGNAICSCEMNIQGSEKRIIDSVLPHEISHTIFATYLRSPVPRWLDEGAATCVEHYSERENYRNMIRHFLQKDVQKGLPFNRMVALKNYPDDVLPFYAQGYSVAEYLITVGGHRLLIQFAKTAIETGDWNYALREHYGIANLGELQKDYWLEWVAIGSPVLLSEVPERLRLPQKNGKTTILADNNNQPISNTSATSSLNRPRSSNQQPKRTTPPAAIMLANYTIDQNKTNSTVTKIPASYTETNNSVIPIPANYKSSYEILSAGGETTPTTPRNY